MNGWNSSLSSGSKNIQRLKEEVYSLKSEIKEKCTSLNRLVEKLEALIERAADVDLLEVQSSGESISISDIKEKENQCSVNKEGIHHYNLIDHIARSGSDPNLNPINMNVLLQQGEDIHEENTDDKGALFKKIDTAKEEKTEREEKNQEIRNTQEEKNNEDFNSMDLDCHQPPVDPERKQESGTESTIFCFNDTRQEDEDTPEHSSDEVVNDNIVQLLSFAKTHESTMTEYLKGFLEDGIKTTEMKNVGQYTNETEKPLMKHIQSWIDTDSITKGTGQNIFTLLNELRNLINSMKYDKGSRNKRQWYLNWYDNTFPTRDYNGIVFAVPFNVSFGIVPLRPRSFIAQNADRYAFECVRLSTFSTYRGRGFGVVFAQAGFVFDHATNTVVCPWCNVFADNDVNIMNTHLSDCVILLMNIPFHYASSAPVPAANRRAIRQVSDVNLSTTPVQALNRQSIERSCYRIPAERTHAIPFIEKKDVRSQAHARRRSTEPSSGLNSHPVSPPIASGNSNQTDSFKHATLSASTFSGTDKSSEDSVPSCTTRSYTCSSGVTGSLSQCHPSGSEHNASVPSGSTKQADYSIDSIHVVFSEPSSSGNGNIWEATRETQEISTLTEGAVGVVVASNTYFCQEDIQKYLLTDAAQAVLDMGYQPKLVLRAIERLLLNRGCEILIRKTILEAILDMEDDDERAKSQQLPSSSYSITSNERYAKERHFICCKIFVFRLDCVK
ncbi:hypothetical protein CHS0354_010977 [Potamilus streckersoni]|uniref:Uncharacterized protein n=1 Tax=Potamilus streckersoni TaxID=2493646 RepID=A0AAE0RQJ6_9BIVA|nr:hypothetical protein CHS0354_010977 [Potamilus streckersoni]